MKEVHYWLCLLNYGSYYFNFICQFTKGFWGEGRNLVSKFPFLLLLGRLFHKYWLNHVGCVKFPYILLIFCLILTLIVEKGMLKSPTTIVDLYSCFNFLHHIFWSLVQLIYFKSCLVHLKLWLLCLFGRFTLWHYVMSFFVPGHFLWFEVNFI